MSIKKAKSEPKSYLVTKTTYGGCQHDRYSSQRLKSCKYIHLSKLNMQSNPSLSYVSIEVASSTCLCVLLECHPCKSFMCLCCYRASWIVFVFQKQKAIKMATVICILLLLLVL